MKASKTILLFLVVLGMGAYIWFYEIHQMSTADKKALELQAFNLPVEQINGIGLRTPDYEVELAKSDQGWELLHPKGARAALPVVQQLLARIKTLDKGELITPADIRAKGQTLAEYGLSVPRIKLMLKTAGQTRMYEVGDKNPLGNSLYVKEDSTQNVMLVSTDLLEVLPKDLLAFRDKTLFPLHEEEVQAIDLINGDQTTRLEKRNGIWMVKAPMNALADQEKVLNLIQKLLQARIEGIVNDPSSEDLANFELAGGEQVIRLWSANSKVPVEVSVGGDIPLNPDLLLVRIAGQEGLVTVSKGMRGIASSPVDLFRDRRLFAVDLPRVNEILIEQDGQSLRLQKTGENWQVLDPVQLKASSKRVQNMIQTWLNARVEQFVDDEVVGEVLMTVAFTSGTGAENQTVRFDVLDGDVAPGRVWLRKHGESGKLVVVPDLVKYAPVDVLPYLSRDVLEFDSEQAVRLSLTQGGKVMAVTRGGPDEVWTAQGEGWKVHQAHVTAILNRFSKLNAQNLVALDPTDLSETGLDQPSIRLSVGLAGEQAGNRTLLVSQTEEGAYGLVQGQNLVFRLSAVDLDLILEPLGTEE
ncbi:DUF4340 domain-containing protein [Kiritimatiellaeota bacterium B1221]|nr:DUF4340 domain-containing protein [Kiritimatiellaeota bacterium B1221]